MHHRAQFCGDRSNCCRDMAIFLSFQDGGRLPSWICDARVSTTTKGISCSITVQNLAGIDTIVSIPVIRYASFNIFRLRLENADSRHKIGVLPEKGGGAGSPTPHLTQSHLGRGLSLY